MPRTAKAKYPYSPGALTAALLHVQIGICSIGALRAEGPISKGDWIKSLGVLGLFLVGGVVAPDLALKDKDSPHNFPAYQMVPYEPEAPVSVTESGN
jgi:hypothetical protein